jgi:enoyl-CoA hydratase/3-hydroxyacyl-CoA dehydrogenase
MSQKQKYEHLKIELPKNKPGGTIDGNYAVVSINRPDKLNSLQVQTVEEIANFLKSIEVDPDVRCVVLRGVKEFTKKPAFSSGADLTSSFGPGVKPNIPMHMAIAMRMRMRYYDEIEQFTKPLIAAVDGFALGGGCELVLVCDIVIASKRSTFGFPEIERGILPGNGGCTRMARRIGLNRALRMTYFGEQITAEQMQDWGLVSWVADDGEPFEKLVQEKAKWLGEAPTTALYVIKKCVKFGTQVPTDIGLHFEQLGFGVNSASSDVKEGIQAFIKKQKPQYKGF